VLIKIAVVFNASALRNIFLAALLSYFFNLSKNAILCVLIPLLPKTFVKTDYLL